MTPTQTAVVALVGMVLGGSGLAAVIVKGLFSRAYNQAKTGDVKVAAADAVIDMLRKQIELDRKDCDRRLSEMKGQLNQERSDRLTETAELRAEVGRLKIVVNELRR